MPSDCQCSTACGVEIKTVVKVLNSKQATARIEKLEKEMERLKKQNELLSIELKKNIMSKEKLVKELKKHLDRIL